MLIDPSARTVDSTTVTATDSPPSAAAMIVNGFTFYAHKGVMDPEVHMTWNHPMCQGKHALFIGTHYILVDNRDGIEVPTSGFVGRFGIKEVSRPHGTGYFMSSVKPYSPVYLHAHLGIPDNMYAKIWFFDGVMEDDSVLVHSRQEYLVSFVQDNQSVHLLCYDGSVKRIVRHGSVLHRHQLSDLEQAEIRLAYVRKQLELTNNLPETERRPSIDRCHYELINMLVVGGKRSGTIFDLLLEIFESAAKTNSLSMGVREKLIEAMGQIDPADAMHFRDTHFTDMRGRGMNWTPPGYRPRIPISARVKKNDRAERDRARTEKTKGPSGGSSNKKAGKNK